jgi:3-dehydroquinate synthase
MSSFDFQSASQRVDIDFQVPFRHRLRFTDDCFADDWPEVVRLFEADSERVRVQIWLDQGLTIADSKLVSRIESAIARSPNIDLSSPIHLIAGGEQIKNNPENVERILSAIHDDRLDRRSYILVIGGGAVLDAVGYAAAVAHRGIRLLRFPSTTLAQADSGVGVKNAVNYFGKKNWTGTFAVPWAVVNDKRLLTGLSDRDFVAGFSEAVKVALLKSSATFDWLCQHGKLIAAREMNVAWQAIRSSVLIHLHHITFGGDPFEVKQARPLDFGHWSAHKLESMTDYQVRHGEAVAIGVALDVVYSSAVFGLSNQIVDRTLHLLRDLKLPIYHQLLDEEIIFEGLEEFRQHLGGRLTLTMLKGIEEMIEVHDIDRSAMQDSIAKLQALAEV